ncbi:hypothetical protein [Streptomyces sp. NPDC004266]
MIRRPALRVPAALPAGAAAPPQVHGAWHREDDYRTGAAVRPMTPLRQS